MTTTRAKGKTSPASSKAAEGKRAATTRSVKGQATRLKILDAVLALIAREGTRGVTHRAVAAEAGVQLSLTTYYFKDIDAMLRDAFVHFSSHSRPGVETFWQETFAYLDGFSAAELRRNTVRVEIAEQLAQRAADYLTAQILDKPVGLAVEQVFFTHTRLSPELRQLGNAHREQLLQPLVALCRRFNRDDPDVDARLLLNTITTLEYQSLAIPPGEVDRQDMMRLLRRNLGWMLGLKRA